MTCPNQAMLLFQAAQNLRQKQELREITSLPVPLTGILRPKHFQKNLCLWGNIPEPRPELSSDAEQGEQASNPALCEL